MQRIAWCRFTAFIAGCCLALTACTSSRKPESSSGSGAAGSNDSLSAGASTGPFSGEEETPGSVTAGSEGADASSGKGTGTSLRNTSKPTSAKTTTTTTSSSSAGEPARAGNWDLMAEAMKISGYASGFPSLSGFNPINRNTFSELTSLIQKPLSAGEYALSTREVALKVKNGPSGVSDFCTKILKEKGFRVSAASYTKQDDIHAALESLFAAANDRSGLETAKNTLDGLLESAKKPVAHWLSAASTAYKMIREAQGNMTEEQFRACAAYALDRISGTGATGQLDGPYAASQQLNFVKMQQAGLLMIQAGCELANALTAGQAVTANNQKLVAETPVGKLIFGSTGGEGYMNPDALLLVEPGGNDTYSGRVAATGSLVHCISTVLDLSGNDTYNSVSADVPSQGCGVLGVGILMDMAGDDSYSAKRASQGCAVLGTGLLYDKSGNDKYSCDLTGQGSGVYGFAVLADSAGKDEYRGVAHVQASAGPRCMAYLVDGQGDDTYYTPTKVPSGYGAGGVIDLRYYPSESAPWWKDYMESASQGCGWGNRRVNNGYEGGGMAALLDFGGNDTFEGSLWVQGAGYLGGIGLLYNEGGNDTYTAYYYSQASVAHSAIGLLVDVGGNDRYTLGLGYGQAALTDRGLTMLLDDGGDDRYVCNEPHSRGGVVSSGAASGDRSKAKAIKEAYSFFFDTTGKDVYHGPVPDDGSLWGWGNGGFAIDCDGDDTYSIQNDCQNNKSFCRSQDGGVFYDAAVSGNKVPYLKFWEDAKKQYGLSR